MQVLCFRLTTVAAIAISITYSECVSMALAIQHTVGICCIISSCVAGLALQYFPTLTKKWDDLRKEAIEYKTSLICDKIITTQNLSFFELLV